MPSHPLAGHLSVDASARRLRHYRYAEERMMRVLGGWIALTPELPAKLLFGRHVWDCAQHADAWGRRLPELRAPAQESEPANPRVVRFMDLLETADAPGQTLERIAGVYRVLKPHLVMLYERHLASSNPIYEPPTRRILERCLGDERRHVAAGVVVFQRLAADDEARARVARWERTLIDALGEAGGITGDAGARLLAPLPSEVNAESVAQDVVRVPPPFDAAQVPKELAAAVRAHAGSYADQLGPLGSFEIVAMARIGRQRVVKARVAGPRGRAVVQSRWAPGDRGWQLVVADVVQADPAS